MAATNYRLGELRQVAWLCRLAGVDALLAPDHWQDLAPRAIWQPSVTWRVRRSASPHEHRESFTALGTLAPFAGRVRLGTAVTEFLRRHPVMVAQAACTLAEATKRPPILGVGAGDRMNTAPYGLDDWKPVRRWEESLEIIRLCWTSSGPGLPSRRTEDVQLRSVLRCHAKPSPIGTSAIREIERRSPGVSC